MTKTSSWEKVKNKLNVKFNGKYTYENFQFENMNSCSFITCDIHGDYLQSMNNHMYKGSGCSKCSYRKMGDSKILAQQEVIERAKKTHNNLYTYDNFVYEGMQVKSFVTCKKHGDWEIHMGNHISCGKGCPLCIRKTESILKNILEQNFNYKILHDKRFHWCKKKRELPYDFVIQDLKCIIELDGRQHFTQIKNWQSPEEQLENDIFKNEQAMKNGYTIIRVDQRDIYNNKKDIILKLIMSVHRYETPQLICIGECYENRFN